MSTSRRRRVSSTPPSVRAASTPPPRRGPAALTWLVLALLAGGAGAACGGAHGEAAQPSTATAGVVDGSAHGQPTRPSAASSEGRTERQGMESSSADRDGGAEEDAELVIGRDVVARCPTLRLVRQHAAELDQDTIWLAVLESVADCMSEGGPMAQQNIGVSGDEEHRHVVREVLGTRGIAPTRVVARPTPALGAAECQGGTDCAKRVEITIVP